MTDDWQLVKFSDAVQALINRTDETVSAKALAPIVRMHPSVIIRYARDGTWKLCECQISGNRVKFCRMDFLRKMGFIPEEAPQKDLLTTIRDELVAIREMIARIMPADSGN